MNRREVLRRAGAREEAAPPLGFTFVTAEVRNPVPSAWGWRSSQTGSRRAAERLGIRLGIKVPANVLVRADRVID